MTRREHWFGVADGQFVQVSGGSESSGVALTLAGQTFANTRIDGIGAFPSLGYYCLRVSVALGILPRPPDRGPAQVVDIGGGLDIQTPDGRKRIGELELYERPMLFDATQWGTEASVAMRVELDRERLEAIERVRNGGDVTFSVHLRARVFIQGKLEEANDVLTLPVNQGVWVKTLNELGYARGLLLEVPVPDEHDRPELAQAVKDLLASQQAVMRGHDREAIGHLRDSLEALGLALNDGDENSAVVDALFRGQRAMDKPTRMRVVRRALKLMTHPARHRDEVTATIEYDRVDAVSLISMVAALMPMAYEARAQAAPEPEKATSPPEADALQKDS